MTPEDEFIECDFPEYSNRSIEDTLIYHARKLKHYLGKYLVGSECT